MNPASTYALVIGINQYECPEYPVLGAAVNDANAVDQYLKTVLNVPGDNIINIRDAQASRQGILDAFQTLEQVTGRSQYPCIIIFYAGHGARTEKPLLWLDWATDSDFVEMLCPCDIGIERKDEQGKVIEGIPDRTVCYLLNQLSTLRGNNITLILDCCCSAGLNRGSVQQSFGLVSRSIPNPPPLSGRADPRVVIPEAALAKGDGSTTTRGMRSSPGFGGKFQDSHVLLAACGRDRVAYENDGRGLFTTTLLSTFQQINLQATTYASLMDRLRMPEWQTPHCEGTHMDRPLFDRGGVRSDPSFISCKRFKNENGDLVVSMDAGMAQGITLGEIFSIHESNLFEIGGRVNQPIGILSAATVESSSTSLVHPPGHKKFKIPRNFYARRIDWRNDPPKVYCKDRVWLESVFPQNSSTYQIDIVNDPADAKLELVLDGERVHIYRNDPLLNKFMPPSFSHTLRRDSPQDVRTIISAWQHFNHHLHRRGKNEFAQVRMELHYLEPIDSGDCDSYEPENYRTTGENLLAREPSEIQVPEADVDKMLGMTLYNDSNIPIYPYLFYFDPNDLTITPWFTAPHGAGLGQVDAPLAPRSKLTIGYGNGAASPWQFCFEDDRDKDIGFFKLFLSASPANFSCIAQDESPFKRLGSVTRAAGRQVAQAEQLEKLDKNSWGIKAATIIQLRE